MASTKRGSLFAAIFQVVFAVPFVAAGLFVLYQGVTGQAKGPVSSIIFGLIFAGVPAYIAIRALRRRSSESQATLVKPAAILPAPTLTVDYRSPGRIRMPAAALYASALQSAPLPQITTGPGRTLAVALGLGKSTDNPLAALVFAIVWTLFSGFVFLGSLTTNGSLATTALTGVFVAVGLFILFFTVRKLVSRTKLPSVEVAEEPVYLGDTLRVHLAQPGPANILRLQVDLICRERVTYTVGTTTRTEQKDVLTFSLLDDAEGIIPRGGSKTHDLEWQVPKKSPSTFFAKHNSVAWLLRIRADIMNFPDYDEIYEVRVLPEPPVA